MQIQVVALEAVEVEEPQQRQRLEMKLSKLELVVLRDVTTAGPAVHAVTMPVPNVAVKSQDTKTTQLLTTK